MRRTSEWLRGLATLACALVLCSAQAQADAPALPDDDALDQAIQHQEHGHPWQAEIVLRRLAEAGNVVAMERLALMHWYGKLLYPGEGWNRDIATMWFARAAARGSDVGKHMAKVAQRDAAAMAKAKP